jgi:hypothetical protein
MSEVHCPFVNQNCASCSEHFKLDQLQYAFNYCFDDYKACPTYARLLTERRVQRANASAAACAVKAIASSADVELGHGNNDQTVQIRFRPAPNQHCPSGGSRLAGVSGV